MKTMKIIKTLFGAALTLLLFASVNGAMGQTAVRIAFSDSVAVNHRTGYQQIFSMNPDGSGVVQLTAQTSSAYAPRWSPGQKYISFWRNHTLFVMQAQGEANGGQTFAVGPAGGFGSDWSPDGATLVFQGSSSNLYLVPIDATAGSTTGSPVLFATGYYYDHCWSSDGTRIAAWGSQDGNTELITIFDVSNGAILASFGAGDNQLNTTPQWSPQQPDGSFLIAFSGGIITTSKSGKTTTIQEIFLANPDGTGLTRETYLNGGTVSPTWSPDGSTLAFRSGNSVYKMPLGGDTLTLLHACVTPDWNP